MPAIAAGCRIARELQQHRGRCRNRRIAQALERFRFAAAANRIGQNRRQFGPARNVGIRIDRNVGTANAGAVDRGERAMDLAPIPAPGGFVVRAAHGNVRGGTDRECLVDRFEQLIAFVAHVRDIARGARFAGHRGASR